jgi:beta-N-acetylhexosaminidase
MRLLLYNFCIRSILSKNVANVHSFCKKTLENYFDNSEYIVVKEEHDLMQEIVDQSFTLIKGKEPNMTSNTLIISSNAKVASIVEDEFGDSNLTMTLKKAFPNNTIVKFNNDINFTENILNMVNEYDNIIVYSYDAYNDKVQIKTINELLKTNKEVFVVSIKGPIDQNNFENLKNYSCLYEYTPNSIKTIVKQLKKEISLNGKLPL